MVSARDFVYASKRGYHGKVFVMGGRSVEYKDAPKSSKIVRAVNGAGCQMVSASSDEGVCEFVWLMDCDYRGMIPTRYWLMSIGKYYIQFDIILASSRLPCHQPSSR